MVLNQETVKNICDLLGYITACSLFFTVAWLCAEKALAIRKERKK